MMPRAFRKCKLEVWFCVSLCLIAGLLQATALNPLGTLRSEGDVYLRGRRTTAEAVVFGGDHLSIGEGLATISFSRGGLAVLERRSTASLQGSADGLAIGLEKGRLTLNLPSPRPVRVETDGLSLSPQGSFPTLTEIALVPNGSLTVAVRQGQISVTHLRPEPIVVSTGQILTVSTRLAEAQKEPVGTAAHGKRSLGEKMRTFHIGHLSHTASVAVAVGGLGGAVVAATVVPHVLKTTSPSSPY